MEHEPSIGLSDEWYTPKHIFDALGEKFDLDPCHPITSPHCYVPAANMYGKEVDGLSKPWDGFVFMNPPFGARNGHVPWLKKFIGHGNGIAIVRAYTSAGWFHDWVGLTDIMLFPRGKTKFVRPDGTIGNQPGGGIVLLGCGDRAVKALKNCCLGIYSIPLAGLS